METDSDIVQALEFCGFKIGENKETRLMTLLRSIMKIQRDPAVPLRFQEIYESLMREEPRADLSKAYVYRLLKSLVDSKMIRVDNPKSRGKEYIVDANTLMAGLEYLKSKKTAELETKIAAMQSQLKKINSLDCGHISQVLVKEITGREQEVSSRMLRGVDELHRVLRYNMLDAAKKGDIVRATMLWAGPFIEGSSERTRKFLEAVKRGVEVRYLVSTDLFKFDSVLGKSFDRGPFLQIIQQVHQLRSRGLQFDVRLYLGPKTYNQISLNDQSMVLILTENPMMATWMTRDFNSDLIDNAVASFDKNWNASKSILEMTPEEMTTIGAEPGGLISEISKKK